MLASTQSGRPKRTVKQTQRSMQYHATQRMNAASCGTTPKLKPCATCCLAPVRTSAFAHTPPRFATASRRDRIKETEKNKSKGAKKLSNIGTQGEIWQTLAQYFTRELIKNTVKCVTLLHGDCNICVGWRVTVTSCDVNMLPQAKVRNMDRMYHLQRVLSNVSAPPITLSGGW